MGSSINQIQAVDIVRWMQSGNVRPNPTQLVPPYLVDKWRNTVEQFRASVRIDFENSGLDFDQIWSDVLFANSR